MTSLNDRSPLKEASIMPFIKIEQLPDEPIFICVFEGELVADDLAEAYGHVMPLWKDDFMEIGCHIIVDSLRVTKVSFIEALKAVRVSLGQQAVLSQQMPHVCWYIVGTSAMAKLYVSSRKLPQFGGVDVPLFVHYADALDAARTAIAAKRAPSQKQS